MAHKAAEAALERYFGYPSFRPAQEVPVASLLANEDILAIMPTGAGKSICFQIPALLKPGLTVVFSPLISLMQDQVAGLRMQNIPAAFINSTLERNTVNRVLYEVRQGRIKLLYVAPERLGSESFQQFLREMPLAQIIIDEAHCVSQWGHDFRPSYQLIGAFLASLPKRPVVGAFTASATQEVEADMKRLLGLEKARVHVTGFDRPNLSFAVVHPDKKLPYVLDFVSKRRHDNGVIYCSTRKDVEMVYGELVKCGVEAGYYHGGLADEVRKQQQELYAYDKVKVMVATNAFGMGIDKSNVRYVLHYQMPSTMEGYYQEAGRAGRDGAPADCVLLYNGRDVMIHKYLIEQSVQEPHRRHIELMKLQRMIDYCFTSQCLRRYMLTYFGENVPWQRCNHCSTCLGKGTERDMTKEAKAIIHAVDMTEERYGASMIAAIVGGARTERIVRSGLDRLPVFGALASFADSDIKSFIKQLVAMGYLQSTYGKYPILQITPGGEEVLAGHRKVTEVRREIVKVRREAPRATPGTWHKQDGRTRGATDSLFERLRQHRKRLAEAAGVPPYHIFPDTVLIDMAAAKPKTLAQLFQIKGIGEVKLKKYGLSFLEVITGGTHEPSR